MWCLVQGVVLLLHRNVTAERCQELDRAVHFAIRQNQMGPLVAARCCDCTMTMLAELFGDRVIS